MKLTKNDFTDLGYYHVRQLDDCTWVGIIPLMPSLDLGLHMGLDETGWSKQYCYEGGNKIFEEIYKLKTFDDIPEGWIAKRPK